MVASTYMRVMDQVVTIILSIYTVEASRYIHTPERCALHTARRNWLGGVPRGPGPCEGHQEEGHHQHLAIAARMATCYFRILSPSAYLPGPVKPP